MPGADREALRRSVQDYHHGHGPNTWPPVLPPPDVTLEVMLEWHDQGCEWPVSGDGITRKRTPRAN